MTSTSSFELKNTARSTRPKRLHKFVAFLVVWALLWATAGFFLLVIPATDVPKQADVLFVLAPAGDRVKQAELLMDQDLADTLAISIPLGHEGNPNPAICNERRTYRVVCFSPDPVTTQGEARALRSLSLEYGWKTANVLTMQSHISRARVIIMRCYKEDLRMIAQWQELPVVSLSNPKRSWAYRFAYETAAFVKVATNQGC